MVFSEPSFLFLFFPVLLGAYFAVPSRLKNVVLLAASLAFYAWDERIYVLLMLGSILFNYGVGLAIWRNKGRPLERRILAFGVVGNLTALIAYKYANFIADNLDVVLALAGAPQLQLQPVHLPIGISFFTFQAMSYVIDVHREQTDVQKNPLDLALYISLFPQLIAGPIVRYSSIADEIAERTVDTERFADGVERFVIGLGKKMLVANPAGLRADVIFALSPADLSAPVAWLGILCYTVQIYFDFSGYSDMAIGLGKMFGFEFLENFQWPYASQSITEFWRRWHISLSSWFRDYLYIPLGGNRLSSGRTYANLVIVFVLCGFWHGASWNFLIWGLFHGALLVAERAGIGRILKDLPRPVRHTYVMLAVIVAWVFFRAETLEDSTTFLVAMAGFNDVAANAQPLAFFLSPEIVLVLVFGSIGSIPIGPAVRARLSLAWSQRAQQAARIAFSVVVLLVCTTLMAAGSYNPFIYFRF